MCDIQRLKEESLNNDEIQCSLVSNISVYQGMPPYKKNGVAIKFVPQKKGFTWSKNDECIGNANFPFYQSFPVPLIRPVRVVRSEL